MPTDTVMITGATKGIGLKFAKGCSSNCIQVGGIELTEIKGIQK
ncbi:hypothetical protein [Neobacillus cucumis]|nr:hypothetical protein [Neobacillus cucumis]